MNLADRLTPGLLEAIKTRKATARSVAKVLGVSEPYMSRTLRQLQVAKTPLPTVIHDKRKQPLYRARREHRDSLARQVKAGKIHVKAAAAAAHCSVRTMYRHIEGLEK